MSSESEAGGRRVRKVGVSPPLDAGQPVAIPDEDDSFVVEASAPRLPRVRRDELDAEDDRRNVAPKPASAARREDSGVLELAEPLNLDMPLDLGDVRASAANDSDAAREFPSDDGATPQGDLSDAWLPSGDDDLPIIPLDD